MRRMHSSKGVSVSGNAQSIGSQEREFVGGSVGRSSDPAVRLEGRVEDAGNATNLVRQSCKILEPSGSRAVEEVRNLEDGDR